MIEFFAKFLLKLAAAENVSVTKMGLDNLAIVFSPGFLRCLVPDLPLRAGGFPRCLLGRLLPFSLSGRPWQDPMKMMANSALEGLFVENLIEVYQV